MIDNTEVSIFKGVKGRTPRSENLGLLLSSIAQGKWKSQIERLRQIRAVDGDDAYNERAQARAACVYRQRGSKGPKDTSEALRANTRGSGPP